MDGDIAVCGGGIVGTSLALTLAREGFSVLLFDRSPPPTKRTGRCRRTGLCTVPVLLQAA